MQFDSSHPPPVLKPSAAAKVFPLSCRRIQQLAAAGRLAGARNFFGYWQIPRESLRAYLNAPRAKGGRPKRAKPA